MDRERGAVYERVANLGHKLIVHLSTFLAASIQHISDSIASTLLMRLDSKNNESQVV